MAQPVVIGLFYTAGTASDVLNRLKSEGVPADHIAMRQLRRSDPLPPTMVAQAHGYAAGPFWGSLVLKKCGDRIGDGETAVCVHPTSENESEVAVGTMKQYVPIGIELISPEEEAAFLQHAKETPSPAPKSGGVDDPQA